MTLAFRNQQVEILKRLDPATVLLHMDAIVQLLKHHWHNPAVCCLAVTSLEKCKPAMQVQHVGLVHPLLENREQCVRVAAAGLILMTAECSIESELNNRARQVVLEVVKQLDSEDPAMAVEILEKLDMAVLAPHASALGRAKAHISVRGRLLDGLDTGSDDVEVLARLLEEKNKSIQLAAAGPILVTDGCSVESRAKAKQAITEVLQQLESEDAYDRQDAVNALAHPSLLTQHAHAVARLLNDNMPCVRGSVVDVLGKLEPSVLVEHVELRPWDNSWTT